VLPRCLAVVLGALLLPSSSPAATPTPGSHYIVHGPGVIGLLHISRQADHLVYDSTIYVNDFCSGVPKGTDPRSEEEWGLWQTDLGPPAAHIDRSGHVSYHRFDQSTYNPLARSALSLELWFGARQRLRGLLWDWEVYDPNGGQPGRHPLPLSFCKRNRVRLTGHVIHRIPPQFLQAQSSASAEPHG
jgi:hypothetical protein